MGHETVKVTVSNIGPGKNNKIEILKTYNAIPDFCKLHFNFDIWEICQLILPLKIFNPFCLGPEG
jgi:hypothetical protein